mgnify:FL=1
MKYIIILLSVFLASCSPAMRLNRLIKNNPELTETKRDTIKEVLTIYEVDTFKIKESIIDTVLIASDCDELIEQLNGLVIEDKAIKTSFRIDTIYMSNKPSIRLDIETIKKEQTIIQKDSIKLEVDKIINITECEPILIYKVPRYMKIIVSLCVFLIVLMSLFLLLINEIRKRNRT